LQYIGLAVDPSICNKCKQNQHLFYQVPFKLVWPSFLGYPCYWYIITEQNVKKIFHLKRKGNVHGPSQFVYRLDCEVKNCLIFPVCVCLCVCVGISCMLLLDNLLIVMAQKF
jgi:hypothetical protein